MHIMAGVSNMWKITIQLFDLSLQACFISDTVHHRRNPLSQLVNCHYDYSSISHKVALVGKQGNGYFKRLATLSIQTFLIGV